MRIRLAILEKNPLLSKRLNEVLSQKYLEDFEVSSFTELDKALQALENRKLDVFLCGEEFEVDVRDIPPGCSFAYFVSTAGIDKWKQQKAICKFQKAELMVKEIQSLFSENAGSHISIRGDGRGGELLIFASPAGGCGSSSLAAALAMRRARQGSKTLYLNLEQVGAAELYFQGPGQSDLGDVIFALKSQKANLPLKLESSIRQSGEGVYFLAPAQLAAHMAELQIQEVAVLLEAVLGLGRYDTVVADMDFSLGEEFRRIFALAQKVIWTSDGSESANKKIASAYHSLGLLEEGAQDRVAPKLRLAYNKFSSKTGQVLEGLELQTLPGMPRVEHGQARPVLEALSQMNQLDSIG